MGTAWCSAQSYTWEQGLYVGGIETAKVNLTLRIYSNAWHVYAGLAILNPIARIQIDRYAAFFLPWLIVGPILGSTRTPISP
jgi:prephenate dehydrogenase (NADP+)